MQSEPPISLPCHLIDGYTILKEGIGRGTFSSVSLAKKGNDYFAIKIFKSLANDASIQQECEVLQQLNAKYPDSCILKVHGYNLHALDQLNGSDSQIRIMVMEYCSGGDLFEYLSKGNKFAESLVRAIFQMFLETLECVHSQGLFHGDLKLENTMVGADGRIRIVDFGFAQTVSSEINNTMLKGTPVYMAPEVRQRNYNGKQADLFALGVLLFVMACRKYPFELTDIEKNSNVVLPDEYKLFLLRKEQFWTAVNKLLSDTPNKEAFKDLINRMLAQKPQQRLSVQGIKQHLWYTSVVPLTIAEVKQSFRLRKEAMTAQKSVTPANRRRQPGGVYRTTAILEEYNEQQCELEESAITELRTLEGADVLVNDLVLNNTVAKLKYLCDCRNYKDMKFYEQGILREDEELKLEIHQRIPEIKITRLSNSTDRELDSMKIIISKHTKSENLALDFQFGSSGTNGVWFYALKDAVLEIIRNLE